MEVSGFHRVVLINNCRHTRRLGDHNHHATTIMHHEPMKAVIAEAGEGDEKTLKIFLSNVE